MRLSQALYVVLPAALFALPSVSFADAQSLVERDLTPLLSSLDQEIQVYAVVPESTISPNGSPVTPNDPRVLQYVESQKTSGTGASGTGFYVYPDPVTPFNANPALTAPWVMIQTVVPAGTKFYNASGYGGQMKADTSAALTQAGCNTYSISGLATTSGCTQIWSKAMSDLNVGMVRTATLSVAIDYCPSHFSAGFVLTGDQAINPSRLVAFSSTAPTQPDVHSENRLILRDLFAHAKMPTPQPTYSMTPAVPPNTYPTYTMVQPPTPAVPSVWPSLPGNPTTNMSAWTQSELYDCGKSAVQILIDETKPTLRTVSRDVTLFSWAPRANVTQKTGFIDGQDQDFFNYADYLVSTFYAQSTTNWDAVGPGLYASIDPVATQSYGNTDGKNDPALMQIILPQGTVFLDLVNDAYNQNLGTFLSTTGCSATNLSSVFEGVTTPACKTLRDQFLSMYNFSALRYSYSATTYANCPNRVMTAFVIKDYSIINNHRMVGFTNDLPSSPDAHSENRLIINELFKLAPPITNWTYPAPNPSAAPGSPSPPPVSTTTPHPVQWPSLANQNPSTNVPSWMTSNIMGCGNYSEDL